VFSNAGARKKVHEKPYVSLGAVLSGSYGKFFALGFKMFEISLPLKLAKYSK
jgi:hypothetical protein